MRTKLTHDEFLNELTRLFVQEGFRSLTVGEIAARLRCSRRRLYDIAPTKEEIFCAMMTRRFRKTLDKGEALIRNEPDLTVAIVAYLDIGVQSSRNVSPQYLKDVESSEMARACFDAYQEARIRRLSELIDEGACKGVFVACNGLVVSELLLGAAMRLRQPAFLARAGLTIDEAFAELSRVVLGGLLVKTAAAVTTPKDDQTGSRRGRNTLVRDAPTQALADNDGEDDKAMSCRHTRTGH